MSKAVRVAAAAAWSPGLLLGRYWSSLEDQYGGAPSEAWE